ncbi:hypothetical protein BUE80_DR003844 [Diplocarpon rosae]|nr:hypothetical protein BUE80_DR003844 [Diplocarpon rosae]
MRDTGSTLLACTASLSIVVRGDSPPAYPSPVPRGVVTYGFGSAASTTSSLTASITPSSLSFASGSPAHSSGRVVIDVSSLISANSSGSATSQATSTSKTNSILVSMASSSAPSSGDDSAHRTKVIVFAVVFGFIGLIIAGASILFIYRFRRGQAPFGIRGASPIHDDEIASWRRNSQEQKLTIPPSAHQPATREVSAMHLNSPEWTWSASPSSIRTISAYITDPQVHAQAPNARVGLTDEAIPGAHPYFTRPKRQSARLSKLSHGHSRSKSGRSSISAKSLWSPEWTSSDFKQPEPSNWYAVDDAAALSHSRSPEHGSSSPATSVYGETNSAGGLSPRPAPRSRPWENYVAREDIGKAIS